MGCVCSCKLYIYFPHESNKMHEVKCTSRARFARITCYSNSVAFSLKLSFILHCMLIIFLLILPSSDQFLTYNTPRYFLKDSKSTYHKDTSTSMFIATLYTIAKLQNQPRYPTSEVWGGNVVLMQHVVLFSNKEWSYVIFRKTDSTRGYHVKQINKTRQILHVFSPLLFLDLNYI